MLVVHARDDPLVSHDDCYDWRALVKNPRLIAVRTNRGGHNAWHEGFWPLGPSWAVAVATDYVSAVLEQTAQTGWLLSVLDGLGPGNARPRAADIARVAAAADHVLEAPPPPPPETPLSSITAALFADDDESPPPAPAPRRPPSEHDLDAWGRTFSAAERPDEKPSLLRAFGL